MTNKDLLGDTAKGALLGTAIGALTGNVGRGAAIGAIGGLGYNALFKGGIKRKRSKSRKLKSPKRKRMKYSRSRATKKSKTPSRKYK